MNLRNSIIQKKKKIIINEKLNSIFIFISRLERSKVRVKFFQSGKPQQISSPEYQHLGFFDTDSTIPTDYYLNDSNFIDDTKMTAVTALPPNFDRQIR